MTGAQIAVTIAGVAAIVWVLWYFLLARGRGAVAEAAAGVQEVRIVVKGGYTPDTVIVQAGTPVRLQFYRDETADCSERVVFDAFGVSADLPAFATTPIEFTPREPGEYPFRCGMNMLKGLLVVEPAGERHAASSPHKFHG
jgi:plastocyanin domain-containing protein